MSVKRVQKEKSENVAINPIKQARIDLRMTQKELAGAVGVHRTTVAEWEAGAPVGALNQAALDELFKKGRQVSGDVPDAPFGPFISARAADYQIAVSVGEARSSLKLLEVVRQSQERIVAQLTEFMFRLRGAGDHSTLAEREAELAKFRAELLGEKNDSAPPE